MINTEVYLEGPDERQLREELSILLSDFCEWGTPHQLVVMCRLLNMFQTQNESVPVGASS